MSRAMSNEERVAEQGAEQRGRVVGSGLRGDCRRVCQYLHGKCSSFGDPVEHRSRAVSTLLPGLSPTHRPHARTPLSRVRTQNSQCNSFERWPKSLIQLPPRAWH